MLIRVLSFPSAPSENRRGHQICERLRRSSGFWCPGVLCSGLVGFLWLSSHVSGEQQHSLQQRLWNTQLRNFCGENISSPFCFPCMKTYWSVHLIVAFKTLVTSKWDTWYSYLLWSVFSSINELWAQTNNPVQCHKDIAVSKTGFKKQNQTIIKWSWKKSPSLSIKHIDWLCL